MLRWTECGGIHPSHSCPLVPCQRWNSILATPVLVDAQERMQLLCPHPDCAKSELTSAGLHQRIRQVVGVSSSYYLASEYLAYKSCKRKFISWSHTIVSQLDIGHRIQFPCTLTTKLGCDI